MPQRLFRPIRCISIWLFCFTGIILPRSDASLSGFSAPQGLFRPPRFISILLFCSAGITLPQSDASLSCSFAPQRLFRPPGFISIWIFCSTGIISAVRIHLYLPILLHRDYFSRPDSSLSSFSVPQGLFRPSGFISIWLFWHTNGMQVLFSPHFSYKLKT